MEVDGADKLNIGPADQSDPAKADRSDKSDIEIADLQKANEANKPDIGLVDLADSIEVVRANTTDIGTIAKVSRRQLVKQLAVVKASFFSFHKVAFLFFSSSELEISSSLAIS